MKKIICIILFFISAGNCFGQQVTFQKTFGGSGTDGGSSIQQTFDGGNIIIGVTWSFGAGPFDLYLTKTDSAGNLLWTKSFGGTNTDGGSDVQQTADSGYIMTGQSASFGAGLGDVYLIKTSVNGNLLWTKTFGGAEYDYGLSVQQTNDGGYIISGRTASFGAGANDVYIIKTDANGDSLWTKTYGGMGDDYGFSVQQTIDGGYVIAGSTNSFGPGNGSYLIKTDVNGDTLWTKTFGGVGNAGLSAMQQTTDGGYILAGSKENFGTGDLDVYLIKTDTSGNSLWAKTYGGMGDDEGYSVQQTTDGGYVMSGITHSFGSEDGYLIKTDVNGNTLWTKTFGGGNNDGLFAIQQTTDGGYILTGSTQSFSTGDYDVYLIKTDSLGNSGCNQGNPTTIVTSPITQVTSPATIVTSPATVVTTPATIVGSGGTVTTLCTTVGIAPISNLQSSIFNISPNPTTNNFTITFPNTINKGVIEIYNVLGEKIFSEYVFNVSQKEILLKNMNAGIYFVKVRDGEKEYCEKLVIE